MVASPAGYAGIPTRFREPANSPPSWDILRNEEPMGGNPKKKVLLVFAYSRRDAINVSKTPPLGIAYIAAFLEEAGHEVHVADMQVDENMDFLARVADYDVLGVSTLTPYVALAYEIVRKAKAAKPSLVTVMGGPHVSALAKECIEELPELDVAVSSEGEEAMVDIVNGRDLASIPSIHIRDAQGKALATGCRTYERDVDAYPRPALHLFPLHKYTSSQPMLMRPGLREGVIVTSRGCPFACNFCFKGVFGRKVRYRTAENVVAELEWAQRTFGYQSFAVLDDLFNVNIKRAKEICRLIVARGLRIGLTFPNGIRADLFDEELAALMAQAGANIVAFGAETGDQGIMDKIGKHLKLDKVHGAVSLCRKYGIQSSIFMIIGHQWDTPDTIQKTIDASIEMDPDYCQFTVATPIPGSAFFTEARAKGRLLVKNYADFDHYSGKQIYAHENLSAEELDFFHKTANRRFYFRARSVLKLLRNPWILVNMALHVNRAMRLFFTPKPRMPSPPRGGRPAGSPA
jgi:anaerobic magnesium-protoporphyrin IX monomethyl ester cyclase